MDRATLLAMITDTAHRPDLVSVAPDFLRQAEGLIAREVRSIEQIATVNIAEADRVTADEPIYTLPTNFLAARAVWLEDLELRNTSLAQLRRIDLASAVMWFSVRGTTIEFRGNPSTDDEMEVDYFSRLAALTVDADTNDLLDNHEDIYLASSLHYLYRYTQDADMAQAFFLSYSTARDSLNASAAHTIGGQATAAAYNFTSRSSY